MRTVKTTYKFSQEELRDLKYVFFYSVSVVHYAVWLSSYELCLESFKILEIQITAVEWNVNAF